MLYLSPGEEGGWGKVWRTKSGNDDDGVLDTTLVHWLYIRIILAIFWLQRAFVTSCQVKTSRAIRCTHVTLHPGSIVRCYRCRPAHVAKVVGFSLAGSLVVYRLRSSSRQAAGAPLQQGVGYD